VKLGLEEPNFAEFGGSIDGAIDVSNAMHCAQLMLASESKAKGATKRIFWLTCSDHAGDPGKEVAVIKANDMLSQQVYIYPFFFQPVGGEKLNLSSFWQDVIAKNRPTLSSSGLDNDPDAPTFELPICDEEDANKVQAMLRRSSARRIVKKRAVLLLPDGHKLGLCFRSLVMKKPTPGSVTLERATNLQITTTTRQICQQTAHLLTEHSVGYLFNAGGHDKGEATVMLEPGEKPKLKEGYGEEGLRVISIRPKQVLKPYHNLHSASFATGCNDDVIGSTTAVRALVEAMAKKEVIMIVGWVFKTNKPSLIALSPQLEVRGSDGRVSLPLGFNAWKLPFADDIRDVSIPPVGSAPSPEALDAARELVAKLSTNYDPKPSPVAKQYWAALEAAALFDDFNPEGLVDETLPNKKLFAAAETELERFKLAIFGENYVEPVDGKRKAAGSGGAAKKQKTALPTTIEEWTELAKAGGLEGLTMDALKTYCGEQGLSKSGKKAELVQKILEHLGV